MISKRRRYKVVGKTLYYAALIIIANGLGFLGSSHRSNCWAGQTIAVSTGANLQALVNQYPEGTTFSFAPGIHRLQSAVVKSYDSFIGQSGASLNGAALLTGFTQSGSYWVAQAEVSQAASYPGDCKSASPACAYPEDVFFDDAPKVRVTSLSSVGPGKWYLDYGTGKVYMGDNPSGHTVEIGKLGYAFTGTATSVTISNLIIEKYANLAQSGAIQGQGGTYWAVGGNQIRYNHGTGIRSGDGMYIYNNKVNNNGQLGIGGTSSNVLIQSNEIFSNNYSGYSYYWESGGVKFIGATNLTFKYNYSHDNGGPGFWTDVYSQQVLCESNQFTRNQVAAIYIELGTTSTIDSNYIWNDGFNPDGTGIWWGAGILMMNSSYVSIYFNTVIDCMNGIGGILADRGNAPNGQPYTLANVNVNSNNIVQNTGMAAGIVLEAIPYSSAVYTSMNNTFQYNNYTLTNPNGVYFAWMGQSLTFSGWNALIY